MVHGGYDASRSEAEAAVEASHRLEKFAFDRLAARSSAYPRATLMSLAQPGLARRGAWNQRIKKFSEEVAPIEDNWTQSFAAYRQELVAARLAAIGAP